MEFGFKFDDTFVVIDNFYKNSCRVRQYSNSENLVWQDSFTLQANGTYVCNNTINDELRKRIEKYLIQYRRTFYPIFLKNELRAYFRGIVERRYDYLLQNNKPIPYLKPTDIIEDFLFMVSIPHEEELMEVHIFRLPDGKFVPNFDFPGGQEEILTQLRNKILELKW